MTTEELDRLKYDLSYKLGLWSNSKHEQQLREFVSQLIAHIDAQAAQIEALKEKLVLERAMRKTGEMFWDTTPKKWQNEYLADARKQLAEDEKLKAAGVTFGDR